MGAVGASKGSSGTSDKYVDGNTTYYITTDGKNYYLHSDYKGSNVELNDKWKISYADNDDKAKVYIPVLKTSMELKSEPKILKLLQDKRNANVGSPTAKNITFTDMMKQASNTQHTISFDKTTTMITSPKGTQIGKIDTFKKNDLGKMIEKSGAKELVVNMYRDKSGANDLKRLKDLGFEIKAQTLGTASAGSKIPPRDYYYMVKKK